MLSLVVSDCRATAREKLAHPRVDSPVNGDHYGAGRLGLASLRRSGRCCRRRSPAPFGDHPRAFLAQACM